MNIDKKEWEAFNSYWLGKYGIKPNRWDIEGYLNWKQAQKGKSKQ